MQEAFWILCSDRIAANENNLEVVSQKLADEFLMDEKVRPFSKRYTFLCFLRNSLPKVNKTPKMCVMNFVGLRWDLSTVLPRFCAHHGWQEVCDQAPAAIQRGCLSSQ